MSEYLLAPLFVHASLFKPVAQMEKKLRDMIWLYKDKNNVKNTPTTDTEWILKDHHILTFCAKPYSASKTLHGEV